MWKPFSLRHKNQFQIESERGIKCGHWPSMESFFSVFLFVHLFFFFPIIPPINSFGPQNNASPGLSSISPFHKILLHPVRDKQTQDQTHLLLGCREVNKPKTKKFHLFIIIIICLNTGNHPWKWGKKGFYRIFYVFTRLLSNFSTLENILENWKWRKIAVFCPCGKEFSLVPL